MIARAAVFVVAILALSGSDPPRRAALHVPRVASAPELDGELREHVWTSVAARTGPIGSRPFSEARFAWGNGALYAALYAADEDITSRATEADGPVWLDDAFRLVFTSEDGAERAIDVSPLGVVTDARRRGAAPFDYAWQSGARVGHDLDGTPNDSRDDDEEWVLEMAIPLASAGLGARTHVSIRRCDTPKGAARRSCAAWDGDLVLD
jgi:hypothetical protein